MLKSAAAAPPGRSASWRVPPGLRTGRAGPGPPRRAGAGGESAWLRPAGAQAPASPRLRLRRGRKVLQSAAAGWDPGSGPVLPSAKWAQVGAPPGQRAGVSEAASTQHFAGARDLPRVAGTPGTRRGGAHGEAGAAEVTAGTCRAEAPVCPSPAGLQTGPWAPGPGSAGCEEGRGPETREAWGAGRLALEMDRQGGNSACTTSFPAV